MKKEKTGDNSRPYKLGKRTYASLDIWPH